MTLGCIFGDSWNERERVENRKQNGKREEGGKGWRKGPRLIERHFS